MKKNAILFSLLFFLIVAILGTLMRYAFVRGVPLNYQHVLHGHSHIAFQGWVYTALFLMIVTQFLTKEQIQHGKYRLQFRVTIVLLIGILVTFLYQGYGLYSIICSTLFQLLNYWFCYRLWKDLQGDTRLGTSFIRLGIIWFVVSTFGPWAVAILSARGYAGSEAYHAAIYFFLHFQYNGWFTFAVFGILFRLLEGVEGVRFSGACLKWLGWSVIPTYFLSLLGMSYGPYVLPLAIIGAALQLIGGYYILSIVRTLKPTGYNSLLYFALGCFALKIILQAGSAIPGLERWFFESRWLIMAYIHLALIGFISISLLYLLFKSGMMFLDSLINRIGLLVLLLGFTLSELLLLMQGVGRPLPLSMDLLFYSSVSMALGVLLIFVGQVMTLRSDVSLV